MESRTSRQCSLEFYGYLKCDYPGIHLSAPVAKVHVEISQAIGWITCLVDNVEISGLDDSRIG